MDREREADDPAFERNESFGKAMSANSSMRRRSSGLSAMVVPRTDDDTENESVSEAGDIGDRALHSNRHSWSGRIHVSVENVLDNSFAVPVQEDVLSSNTKSFLSPSQVPTPSPLSIGAMIQPAEERKEETEAGMPWVLEYTSCLAHLAVCGILGVLTRYLLQKLFGPGVIGATSDHSYMYLDLPANMVGSFLMGWFGVVFKSDISKVSDQLAIGLTTGYLGSLTTFSGWNQKMLDLSVKGKWVFAILGYFIGLMLAAYSIIMGIETAEGFKSILQRLTTNSKQNNSRCKSNMRVDTLKGHVSVLVVLALVLGLLWSLSGALESREFHTGSSEAQLWLACIVGPIGVWIRWYLARLNGRGLGKKGLLKWVPFGTMIANVSAACVMAGLATLKKAVNTQTCNTVATGMQFGLMGCLSTVSTFIAEFHAMRRSDQTWRAYAYATATIVLSFSLGTLIYSVPVWVEGYD